jgi:pimeloyl-ACP methyl ester carboxylesterase
VSIKASYYFDILSADKGYSLLETKADNIDTYSIRLKDIIDNVKYITGKDKVIIIAHSMGGLVTRRYIQVFGENSVDKVILVAVPNHGVDGFVVDYCSIFGTNSECSDMNPNSLFLNKLNRGSNPSTPFYNIIGEGCTWENSLGDGIAKNESAYLSFATNYYVKGSCNGFDYFHNNILETEKYPEVYDLIKEILNK